MKLSFSVIGANFGDEGKGATVDYLASKLLPTYPNALLVKVNGGCQAGHTVGHDGDLRHVFHQIGSATFRGVPTIISEHCIYNPVQMHEEYQAVCNTMDDLPPEIFVHNKVMITTPYDEIFNQCLEKARIAPHGSCGYGINETVIRYNSGINFYTLNQLITQQNAINHILITILNEYFLKIRFPQIMLMKDIDSEKFRKLIFEDYDIRDRMWADGFLTCIHKNHVQYLSDEDMKSKLDSADLVIFEHSQGLLLDENNHKMFPHLTRSSTGSTNVIRMFEKYELNISHHHNVYVTRPYLTRHGNGPLPFEKHEALVYGTFDIKDPTNVPNTYQGSIRYAPFNIDLFQNTVNQDLDLLPTTDHFYRITCLDQMRPGHSTIPYISNNVEIRNILKRVHNSINYCTGLNDLDIFFTT